MGGGEKRDSETLFPCEFMQKGVIEEATKTELLELTVEGEKSAKSGENPGPQKKPRTVLGVASQRGGHEKGGY